MNVFRDIWFNTGTCIDYFLVEKNQKPFLKELIWIQGAKVGLLAFLRSPLELGFLFLIVSMVSTVMVARYLLPWILVKTGKLMNGQASFHQLQLIVGFSAVPALVSLCFAIISILIPGETRHEFQLVEWIVWILTWRILVIGVAKVQKISYEFALMNVVLAPVTIVIIYLILRPWL
jgi:hypothetical protein